MLEKIIRVSNASLVQLQGKQLLIHQQQSILDSLQQQLMEIGNVQHNCATLPTNNEVQQEGTFSMTNQSAKQYVLNMQISAEAFPAEELMDSHRFEI